MSIIYVRLIEERDRPALRILYLVSRTQTFSWLDHATFGLNDFDHDTEGESIWVAVADDQTVGFVSVWMPDNFIHCLFVHHATTRRGIGSALIKTALASMSRPATLKCKVRNVNAMRFYLAHGWRIHSYGENEHDQYYLLEFTD